MILRLINLLGMSMGILLPVHTSAALVEMEWIADSGDGYITRDSANGLDSKNRVGPRFPLI